MSNLGNHGNEYEGIRAQVRGLYIDTGGEEHYLPLSVDINGALNVNGLVGGEGGGGGATLVETLWTDNTGAYYVRIDDGTSINWATISGTSTTAPGTGARPADGSNINLDKTAYKATASGTGYTTGDYLAHYVLAEPKTGVIVGNYWINATASTKLASAPSSGDITFLTPLPANAAIEAGGNLEAIALATGAKADASWSGTGAGSVVAILKAIWGHVSNALKPGGYVRTLLAPGLCRTFTTTGTSQNQTLTAGINGVSIVAIGADAFVALGDGAQTASTSTIFLQRGERLDFDASTYLAPALAYKFGPSAAAATLYVIELS